MHCGRWMRRSRVLFPIRAVLVLKFAELVSGLDVLGSALELCSSGTHNTGLCLRETDEVCFVSVVYLHYIYTSVVYG